MKEELEQDSIFNIVSAFEYKSIGTHWLALYMIGDSFGAQHHLIEIKKFIGNKSIATNIHGVQTNDSIMCGYYFMGFTDFMQIR